MPHNPLQAFKRSVTSQHGEDGVIARIFEIVKEKNRWCVEFGAVDGKTGSNTWNLIKNRGWKGVLIEAHPAYFRRLQKEYKGITRAKTLNLMVGFEGENTLDNILAREGAPKDIDFASIDIDGADYHVWDSLREFRPRVVMIECNPRIPQDISFIQPRDLSVGWGSSLKALVELGRKKGYELVYTDATNAIFVQDELYMLFDIEDNHIEAMLPHKADGPKFFQMFDGSIVLYGLPPEHVLMFKKKPKQPLFIWHKDKLIPIPVRGSIISRTLKSVVKRIPFYYRFIYPFAERFYGRQWRKKLSKLS